MTSARGTSFEHRPSATLTALVATVLCLATVAPFFTSLPWYFRWPLTAVVGAFGLLRLRAFRRSPVAAFRLSPAGLWTVTLRSGRDVPAELAESRLFASAVFLRLRWRGGEGQVALLPDNTPADDLRFLRARLRTAV
ncbi:hypothetical protein [Luteibacter sp.]|jgi:hypothetical protein|uniref:hypothetical protein n=1 Tax=Luteibacter sp. TaxID=1886636 RepID=UPI002F42D124